MRCRPYKQYARKSIHRYKARAQEHPPIQSSRARSGRYVGKLIFASLSSLPLNYHLINITRNFPAEQCWNIHLISFVKYNPCGLKVVGHCCRIRYLINSLGEVTVVRSLSPNGVLMCVLKSQFSAAISKVLN